MNTHKRLPKSLPGRRLNRCLPLPQDREEFTSKLVRLGRYLNAQLREAIRQFYVSLDSGTLQFQTEPIDRLIQEAGFPQGFYKASKFCDGSRCNMKVQFPGSDQISFHHFHKFFFYVLLLIVRLQSSATVLLELFFDTGSDHLLPFCQKLLPLAVD